MSTRRRLTILSAAGLAVLAVLALSAVFAVQPSVLATDARLKTEATTLAASKHAGALCQDCHAAPTIGAQFDYDVRVTAGMFGAIFGVKRDLSLYTAPVTGACERCHKSLITVSPSGDLKIPHRAHVDILHVPCVRCHAYLVHGLSPEGKHAPTMAGCLTCHDGKQAKNTCTTCHTAKAAPASHEDTSTWLLVHPQAPAESIATCAKCHGWTKNWCADCHSRRPPSHTAGWRKTHGAVVATMRPRDCEVCHTRSFCVNCHGVLPPLNYSPAVKFAQ